MHSSWQSKAPVIAATNRIDIPDPALLRSSRLGRKIEFPLPEETARVRILEIHSRKMLTATVIVLLSNFSLLCWKLIYASRGHRQIL